MTAWLPIDTTPRDFVPAAITDAEGAAAFRAVLNLFRLWSVTDENAAILLDLPIRSYRRWKAGELGRIDRDAKARLSNLMGIHKALRISSANLREVTPGSRRRTPPSGAGPLWK